MVFDDSKFEEVSSFGGRHFQRYVSFKNTIFQNAINFTECHFPQNTFFENTEFAPECLTVYSEPSFRHLRKCMSEILAKDYEGEFYVYEQRCKRNRRGWKKPLSFITSWLYDKVSLYGESYERAFKSILLTQVVFWILYIPLFNFDTPKNIITQFTLSQIFKPFELLSIRKTGFGEIENYINNIGECVLPYLATVHSLFTFTFFALFLLALRWRFKKG
jgi:hypothetical protein